jgi:threonine/homoserine/homoserine lactone efflux protein
MIDESTLLLYLPAMLAITLAPGADTLFVVGSALRSGSRGGLLATCGIVSGGVVHIGFATIGLSALILHSAIAFTTIKYIGAAYLCYLGVRALLAGDLPSAAPPSDARTHSLFLQGFLTNALNPKVALFVLAFLPQFVSPARGPLWTQFLTLGAIWYVTGFLWLGTVGIVVGRARAFGSPSLILRRICRYTTASIFIALGIRVALSER